MSSNNEPWSDSWEKVRPLGAGGHGTTFIVRPRKGTESLEYVLKVLNSPRDPERRERLRREVAALRKLDVPGVPGLVDANDQAEDPRAPLFMVRELVPGPTLEEVVARGPLGLAAVVDLMRALLRIVNDCHSFGVYHRDIKPDNIILQDAAPGVPYLVDFGLAVVDGDGMLTGSEQQLGNRFLALPELLTPEADKRDPASDVTQCCGILFYALTGIQPMTLTDGNGQKPHQRGNAQSAFAILEPGKRIVLAGLLDRGFEPRIADRWETPQDLLRGLEEVDCPKLISPKHLPDVRSLWTLHMERGRLAGLYFHHFLREDSELKDFFVGNLPVARFETLADTVRRAGEVLWNEVQVRPEVAVLIPKERPFLHAFDHVTRTLEDGALTGTSPSNPVKWNRELDRPNGRVAGPAGPPITVESLTSAGQAAVAELDRAARESALACIRKAIAKRQEWETL